MITEPGLRFQRSRAYIMWAGSPYAHVHIMGRPRYQEENFDEEG